MLYSMLIGLLHCIALYLLSLHQHITICAQELSNDWDGRAIEFSLSSAGYSMGYFSLTQCFSVIAEIITIDHILTKSRFFCRRNFKNCAVIGTKSTRLGEMTQNNGYYAVQGHSRSTISVPIENPYDLLCVNTYFLSCSVSETCRIIGPIFALDREFLSLTHSWKWTPSFWMGKLVSETRNIYLCCGAKYMSISWTV